MENTQEPFEKINAELAKDKVVLFMKGGRTNPKCGFSAKVVGMLDSLLEYYHTVDVLEDASIRGDIKLFSDWPTIPQLYIDKEFIGGCDLVENIYNSGELHQRLWISESYPKLLTHIRLSDEATKVIKQALVESEGNVVHLIIDKDFNHDFQIAPKDKRKYMVLSNGIEFYLDDGSLGRASGLEIDMVDSSEGYGFKISNPNVRAKFQEINVEDFKAVMDSEEKFYLFDVRTLEERGIASIEGSLFLDEAAIDLINKTDRDTRMIFFCHSGVRSAEAAKYFFEQGFVGATNLVGGIDAWSVKVDPMVPRY
ncbi:MAG: Grx4 family monothiol glutaredoxin [Pseudomonadota bacterium]|nr:Grx4 family monothiol glutaredoxin [Pseudomonadota bacterium]